MYILSYVIYSLLLTITICFDVQNETVVLHSQKSQVIEAEGGSLPILPKTKSEINASLNTPSPKLLSNTVTVLKIVKSSTVSPVTETNISTPSVVNLKQAVINLKQTEKPVPTKPSVTEHDDVPSQILHNKSEVYIQKIPSIDTFETKNRRADYVIPIVAVILSVPLLAIIISVLYKRGTDWWQHRNYRRMDFLIEGMYNN